MNREIQKEKDREAIDDTLIKHLELILSNLTTKRASVLEASMLALDMLSQKGLFIENIDDTSSMKVSKAAISIAQQRAIQIANMITRSAEKAIEDGKIDLVRAHLFLMSDLILNCHTSAALPMMQLFMHEKCFENKLPSLLN